MSETTAQPNPPSDGKLALRVLVVEDSEFDARMLVGLLRAGGFEPEFERVETEGGMRTALGKAQWEVILADYNLPDFSAPRALEVLQESQLDIPFIIVSGGIGEDTAVAAMKSGAHDYLMKGNLARLVPAVERELREAAVRSSRRQTVKDLRASELRHRSLIENTSDIIALQGHDSICEPGLRASAGHDCRGTDRQRLVCAGARGGSGSIEGRVRAGAWP